MSKQWTHAELSERLVRYTDLRPCLNAFVDTYTPGSDKKENFTVIGPGVAEHPDQQHEGEGPPRRDRALGGQAEGHHGRAPDDPRRRDPG